MINFRSFAFTSALAIGCAVEPPSTQPDATTQFTDVPDASITPDKATNTPDVLTPLHEPPSITLQDQHSGTAFPGTWVHLTGTATGHGSAVHQFEPSTELSELTTSSRTDQGNMSGIWRFRIPCNTTPGRQQFTFTAVDADGFHSEASIEIDVRALDSNGTNEISRPITLCTESGDQVSTSFHISANDIRFDAHETSFYPNTTISIGNPTGTIYDTTLTGLGVVQGLITAQNVGRLTISGGSFRPRATEPALVISHSFR
ncbi:MAG: hypothetical protein IPJ69_09310 [Deltaproteobacteria bacterium]|nr:MAG: hypothetical protein IPJ69_09310 [Deltaproteobacteria bacterium]